MLLHTDPRDVTVSGVPTTAFTIAANGKAFKIMIDGLYSDKEWAIVRELSTNAYDAHIMAGNAAMPFQIHCPSYDEPWFSVRDFGTGMSPDYMVDGYTRVFHSTKDDSNTQVGAFGLGRMTPFAKTDTYTVTSWYEGVRRVYSVFLNQQRIPAIAMLAEEASSEPAGVEINIAVNTDDIHAFKTAIVRGCQLGFPVTPTITGGFVSFKLPEVSLQGNGWRILKKDHMGNAAIRGAHAIQGCVAYPIDQNLFTDAPEDVKPLLKQPLVLDFAIGELEVTASRESLSYDAQTQAALVKKLEQVAAEYLTPFRTELDACTTMWEAYRVAFKLTAPLGDLGTAVMRKLRWKGRELSRTVSITSELARYDRPDVHTLGGPGLKASIIDANDLMKGRSGVGRRVTIKWEPTTRAGINPDRTIVLFEDPVTHVANPGLRIRCWADANRIDSSILWLKGDPKSYAAKRMLAKLGRPEVTFVADLPKPPRAAPGSYPKTRVQMKRQAPGYAAINEATIVEQDNHVYVDMVRDDIFYGPNETHGIGAGSLQRIAKLLREAGYLEADQGILCVPATHKKAPLRNPHWRPLRDVVVEALANFNEQKAAVARGYKDVLSDSEAVSLVAQLSRSQLKPITTQGPMQRLAAFQKRAADKVYEARTQLLLADLRYEIPDGERVASNPLVGRAYAARVEACQKAYPMLALSSGVDAKSLPAILDYVKLIDTDTTRRHSVSHITEEVAA